MYSVQVESCGSCKWIGNYETEDIAYDKAKKLAFDTNIVGMDSITEVCDSQKKVTVTLSDVKNNEIVIHFTVTKSL